jgi:hypothetical protein
MKTKDINLLTEINVMRSMMGLKEKTLITEQPVPVTLANTFLKSSAKYLSKSADEIAQLMSIPLAKARNMKTWFDDLDVAIKNGSDDIIKKSLYNIFANSKPAVINRYVDDILSETGTDTLVGELTKRAKSLKAQGVADDAIKAQLKTDIDDVLEGLPDSIKNPLKDKVDNIFKTATAGVASTSKVVASADGVFSKLSENVIWADLMKKFPEVIEVFKKDINDFIAAGAKTEGEIVDLMLKKAKTKIDPTLYSQILSWYKGAVINHPKLMKLGRWGLYISLVVFGGNVISTYAGGAGFLRKGINWLCDITVGSQDPWCKKSQENINDMDKKALEGNENNTNSSSTDSCPGEDVFKSWSTVNFNDSGTFNEDTCTGTVFGDEYTWNGTEWK